MRIYTPNNRNHKKNISIINLTLLLFSLAGYIILTSIDNPAIHFPQYILLIMFISITYFYLVLRILKNKAKGIWNILIVLLFSFIFRIILINQAPWFSNDVYRYLWDGRVSDAGLNPYRYPPEHEQLIELRDGMIYPQINYPEIATVYPPVAQFFFWINFQFGNSLVSWKIVLLIMEIFLTLVLFKLIALFKFDSMRIAIYTANPLVITETYLNGHLEILALLFLWLAIYLFHIRREWLSILALIPAFLGKFLPVLIFLPFLRPKTGKKFLIFGAICAAIVLPFAFSGVIPMSGFFSYVNRWSFNGAVFKVITSLLYMFPLKVINLGIYNLNDHLESVYINQEFYYKIIVVIILLIVIIDQLRKSRFSFYPAGIRPLHAAMIITGTFLLLTPTLHPWYILWIIPFLVFTPKWSWLVFTFLIQLSYQVLPNYLLHGIWQEQAWILFLEYGPFYGILIWEYLDRQRIKGWFL